MSFLSAHSWIDSQHHKALLLLENFCAINSHTKNLEGLSKMKHALVDSFSLLNGDIHETPCKRGGEPLGSIITIEKRKEAPLQVLLGGHMDTVYPLHSPFQNCINENDKLIGPGVCDMKGGLVVLLYALLAFENHQKQDRLGWKVVINSDEEIGSPGSRSFWKDLAPQYDFGLIYEPSYPDGALVSLRKGSVNVLIEVKGRTSHAGRDFLNGRSANLAMVRFLSALFDSGTSYPELTINAGELHGGTAANVIPDKAYARINLRSFNPSDLISILQDIQEIQKRIGIQEEVSFQQTIESNTPPKQVTPKLKRLFEAVETTSIALNQPFLIRPSGGACDGNALMEAGLPNIDTMGVIGGNMHTDEEYMIKASLAMRAKLSFQLLWKYSEGEIPELMRER